MFDVVMTIWRGLYERRPKRFGPGPLIMPRETFERREQGRRIIARAFADGPIPDDDDGAAPVAAVNRDPRPSDPDVAEAAAVMRASLDPDDLHRFDILIQADWDGETAGLV